MEHFPAFLDLKDKSCLLVGGGDIALRKLRLLTSAGARVTIVAPQIGDAIREIADVRGHRMLQRRFRGSDVDSHWLVVSATGNPSVERSVFEAADAARIFCNGVDSILNCSFITPAIVDRGPVVVAISSGGAAPVLVRQLRSRIEALLPSGLSVLANVARRWRERVREVLPTVAERRRFWESVFDGPVATAALHGGEGAAEQKLAEFLQNPTVPVSGEAWLVGAGPGDPGLLTLNALQIMQSADVILHDRLVSTDVLDLARRDADLISVGKTPGCRANSQEEINELLVKLVASGKRVCRLKGGDPFIFGRGGEEAEALATAGLPYRVVPGITAAAGCAAYAGIPLTHRGTSQSVSLITAHGQDSVDNLDWRRLASDQNTLAFYMAVRRFPDLMNNLIDNGRVASTPIAIVENGTSTRQRVVRGTLGQLTLLADAHQIVAPAMLIVGEVAALGAHALDGSSIEDRPQSASIYAKPSERIANKG